MLLHSKSYYESIFHVIDLNNFKVEKSVWGRPVGERAVGGVGQLVFWEDAG